MQPTNKVGAVDNDLRKFAYQEHAESLSNSSSPNDPNGRDYYARVLSLLDAFVEHAESTNEIPILPRLDTRGYTGYEFSPLAQGYFYLVPEFVEIITRLSDEFEYSEYINAFRTCCNSMKLGENQLIKSSVWRQQRLSYLHTDSKPASELFNTLVSNLRIEAKSENVKRRTRSRLREAEERYQEYCDYIDELFKNCARLVVLRIDLFYGVEHAIFIDLNEAQADIDHFLANRRCNSIFHHLKGYIIKLEYGIEKRLHFHVLLMFDGSKRSNTGHIHLTKLIGDYWVNVITRGRGAYWNCNARIDDFKKLGQCGIGTINADQLELIHNLKHYVIRYLCKTSQFVRPKFGSVVKLIRRGNHIQILK